jgi:ABC-type lipoprotein export system ATPase subunit
MTECLVELRDVFRVHRTGQGDAAALQGAELDVFRGEILCVLGPSGAGKSTILRVIAGIDTPSAGIVRVLGTDIGRRGERARARFRNRHLGLLSQSLDSAPSSLAVAQAIELPLAVRGNTRQERRQRVGELLQAVGLEGRGRARLTELSGGERQRVALCAAIAHRPTLLLADEPTGELDAGNAEVIRRLIGDLARATGMTVVVASHDPVMAGSADRTVTIAGGRIAEERKGSGDMLVVSRGGWLRLPPAQRGRSAIRDRARSELVGTGFVIEPEPGAVAATANGSRPPELQNGSGPADVELRSLARAYGSRTVLNQLTHNFAPQKLTVVAGRSGSGKTTLLRLIAGLDRADAGEVLIDAQPLTGRDREQLAALRRARIGYMPQEPATVEFLSASENVALALALRGVGSGAAAQTVNSLLTALGLEERAAQRVERLSAGEVQRVALARAMAAARGLLILDEPTSRLDEASAELVAGLIGQAARGGQTVICATHDPRLTERADEVLALSPPGIAPQSSNSA